MEKQSEHVHIADSTADVPLAEVPSQRTEPPLVPEQPAEKAVPSTLISKLKCLNQRLEALSAFEARGIARVPPEERQPPSTAGDVQIALLWFSANISCNNLIVGLYGPLLFQLGFLDSAMCAVFGAFLGSLSTAFMAIWGPKTGHRTSMNSVLYHPIDMILLDWYSLTEPLHSGCLEIFLWLVARQAPNCLEHCSHGRLLLYRSVLVLLLYI